MKTVGTGFKLGLRLIALILTGDANPTLAWLVVWTVLIRNWDLTTKTFFWGERDDEALSPINFYLFSRRRRKKLLGVMTSCGHRLVESPFGGVCVVHLM